MAKNSESEREREKPPNFFMPKDNMIISATALGEVTNNNEDMNTNVKKGKNPEYKTRKSIQTYTALFHTKVSKI